MMMKKATALLLALMLLFSLTACGDDTGDETPAVSHTQEEASFTPGHEALTITIPSCAVDIISDNLYAMAASFGISDIRDGAEGSLICYIEHADKAQVQMAAKKNLFDTADYLMNNTDFITDGEVGYNCDSFTFFCDVGKYLEPADVYLMSYYVPAMTYHALTTPDGDFLFNKKMTFTFLDSESLELLGEFEFDGHPEEEEEKN